MSEIYLVIGSDTYVIQAQRVPTVLAPETEPAKKETVQQRQAAVKEASAAAGPAGPGPEKAEIPTEFPKATETPAAATKVTPTGRKRGQTVTNPAAAAATAAAATTATAAAITVAAAPAPAPAAKAAPAGKVAADMPSPTQLDEYRKSFMSLVKQLTVAGAQPKGDVAVATQLRNLLLKFNKTATVEALTNTQWTAFFDRVNSQYLNGEAGIAGLVAKL